MPAAALIDVLDCPAPEGARKVASELLAAVRTEHERWQKEPTDVEALHDFRVALRRLRSWLRAFRVSLEGAVSPKVERRLRALQEATGASRDADVQRHWVHEQRPQLSPAALAAARWLLEEQPFAEAVDLTWVRTRFARCDGLLSARCATYALQLPVGGAPSVQPLSWVWATVLRQLHAELIERAAGVQGLQQSDELHRVRIRAKRLRYCLMPLKELDGASAALKLLKQRQDLLGELNDRHVLYQTLEAALPRGEALGHGPGLEALSALARVQQGQRYEAYLSHLHTDVALGEAVEAVCAALSVRRGLVLEIMPAP